MRFGELTMTQPKASTLQQRFGFQDDDLKNPNHDEIMMWLDSYVDTIVKLILKYEGSWSKEKIDELQTKNYISGELPIKPAMEIKKIWEYPVQAKNGFMIGFIDMLVEAYPPCLTTNGNKWEVDWHTKRFVFEVKSILPTLGELIRQIRMYEEFVGKAFYVVAPDDKYAKMLNQQGIGFIKYPEGTISEKTP
jgi:hypothetical protein